MTKTWGGGLIEEMDIEDRQQFSALGTSQIENVHLNFYSDAAVIQIVEIMEI